MSPKARTGKHREHRPFALGPRVFARGQFWACDARPWGGGKPTLRDPTHPGWPKEGDRLPVSDPANEAIAHQWAWAFTDRDAAKARRAGRKPRRPLRIVRDGREYGAIPDFLAWREQQEASPNTLSNNGTALNILARECGDAADAHGIGREALQAILDRMAGQGYAAGTVRQLRNTWGAFFRWLGAEPNPARGVVVPPLVKREPHAWTDLELVRLRAAADAVDANRQWPLARLVLDLGLATGGRAGELRAMRWEDFDRDTETVRIHEQRMGAESRHTKGKRGRTALVLREWWDWHYEAGADGLILHDRRGRPISDNLLSSLVQRTCDRAGLRGTPHDMRRTYGRLYLLRNGTLDGLKYALGHKSIRTTEDQYAAVKDAEIMQRELARMAGGPRLLP